MTPADPLGRLVKAIQDEHAQSIPSSHFDLYDNCPHDVCEAARAAAQAARPGEGAVDWAEVVARVLRGEPEANGEYLHLVECSGDRREPPGMRGVSCCCRPGATADLRRLLAAQSRATTPTDADVEAMMRTLQEADDPVYRWTEAERYRPQALAALRARREGV